MAKQPMATLSASLLAPPPDSPVAPVPVITAPPPPPAKPAGRAAKPVAQTVKLSPEMFVALKSFSASRRMTHQTIFVEALREYLGRHSK